jgi:diguanylate cyclase (GGDEF)-like protein
MHRPRTPAWWAWLGVKLVALWIGVMIVALGVRTIRHAYPTWGGYCTELALAGAAIGGFITNMHCRRRDWVGPMERLRSVYTAVRQRDASIDELTTVGGQIAPATALIEELLRELRIQETRIAELNDELRQRVAQRTEVLERRIGSLKRQSSTDTLTGLHNRRQLDQSLPRAIEYCHTNACDLCVLMVDVDYFKNLNDLKGHACGDEFLRSIGQLIRSAIRDLDEAFRVGGDEFVVLLPGMAADAGQALADRLTFLTEALAKTYKVPLAPKLSIGVSTLWTAPEPTGTGLLAEADRKLYAIKSARTVHSRAG